VSTSGSPRYYAEQPEPIYVYTNIQVRATLSGGSLSEDVELECIGITMTYALNTIPTARVFVAFGKDTRTFDLAAIHEEAQNLSLSMRIKVEANFSEDGPWPVTGEWWTIFEGLTSDVGFTQQLQGITYVLECLGWLDDLNFSSAMSRSTTPATPMDFYRPLASRTATGANRDRFVSTLSIAADGALGGVSEDIWLKVIKPAMTFMASEDRLRILGGSDAANDEALEALNRMDLDFNVPLPIAEVRSRHAILRAIGAALFTPSGGNTLWEKLLNLSTLFLFAVVPTIESAYVLPLVSMLLGDQYITIDDSELADKSLSGKTVRPVRSLSLYSRRTATTGYNRSLGQPGPLRELAGYDLLDDYAGDTSDIEKGLMLYRPAPSWLANGTFYSSNQRAITKVSDSGATSGGTQQAIKTSVDPAPAEAQASAKTESADPTLDLASRYARTLFFGELFKTRSGTITGRLRFDVSPGSSVQIIQPGGDKEILYFGKTIYALVTGVTITIDSRTPFASTSFSLSHIRKESEFDGNMGVDQHPIYLNKWLGTTLYPQPQIEGEAEVTGLTATGSATVGG